MYYRGFFLQLMGEEHLPPEDYQNHSLGALLTWRKMLNPLKWIGALIIESLAVIMNLCIRLFISLNAFLKVILLYTWTFVSLALCFIFSLLFVLTNTLNFKAAFQWWWQLIFHQVGIWVCKTLFFILDVSLASILSSLLVIPYIALSFFSPLNEVIFPSLDYLRFEKPWKSILNLMLVVGGTYALMQNISFLVALFSFTLSPLAFWFLIPFFVVSAFFLIHQFIFNWRTFAGFFFKSTPFDEKNLNRTYYTLLFPHHRYSPTFSLEERKTWALKENFLYHLKKIFGWTSHRAFKKSEEKIQRYTRDEAGIAETVKIIKTAISDFYDIATSPVTLKILIKSVINFFKGFIPPLGFVLGGLGDDIDILFAEARLGPEHQHAPETALREVSLLAQNTGVFPTSLNTPPSASQPARSEYHL